MELTITEALQKGVEAHRAGKIQEADRYYTAILKAQPKHPDANHNMGVLAVGVGKINEGLPFFKTAVDVSPNKVQFWLSYIRAFLKLDRINDAITVFEQAKKSGAKGNAFDNLAKELNKWSGSTYVESPNIQEPSQGQLQSIINLYSQGQYKKALSVASQLEFEFPHSVNIYNIVGAVRHELGHLDEAIEAYKKATSIKPDCPQVNYNMGNTLKQQGKLDQAIEAYKKATSIKPDYAKAYYNEGAAFQEQGKLDQAIEAYKKATSVKPDYADVYNNIGTALQEQGQLEEAINTYEKSLAIRPNYAEAYNNMGTALQEQGKLEEAINAYEKSICAQPNYADVMENCLSLEIQLMGAKNINNNLSNISNYLRHGLEKRPKLLILKAIHSFLLEDLNLSRKYINTFNSYNLELIDKLRPIDRVFCPAYAHFLCKLNNTALSELREIDKYSEVYHIGESHCLSYAHKFISLDGTMCKIIPKIIFGAKAFHFSRGTCNKFKEITKVQIKTIPKSSKLFLSFGEIDCRQDEGFISAAYKLKKPIEDLIISTVEGYLSWFAKQNTTKHHRIYILNVPAPIYNRKHSAEVNTTVVNTIKLFNHALKQNISSYNFKLIDVFQFTVGKDGFSNGLYHIDDRHLSNKAIFEIEKQLV